MPNCAVLTKIVHKMKLTTIILLFLFEFGSSNDFQCVYFTDTMESVEFYCENFNETLPANCSATYLYSIGYYDKSKVARLKIAGCDEDKIDQIIGDFPNIHSLDISCSNLRLLKPFDVTLQHLRKFNASNNGITQIPNGIWKTMPRLTNVDFSYNRLKFIWNLTTSLTRIDLSHNKLSYIGRDNLIDLPNVEVIDLSFNQVEKIDHANIFKGCENLFVLQLEGNKYRKFDERFHHMLKNGVALHFSWQHVTDFRIEANIGRPIQFVTNSTLEGVFLSLDKNRTEIHCREGIFDNISTFKIIDNNIENLSEMFRCLTPSLEQLILSGNLNKKISSTLLEPFINLWKLVVNGAQSMDFDWGSIKNPRRLHFLDISNNNLKEIGNVSILAEFSSLSLLNVAENQLKIPSLLDSIPDSTLIVRELNLNGNSVGKLDHTTFERVDVNYLYLRNTNLSFDDIKPFETLVRLIELDISHNNLVRANFAVRSEALKRLSHFSAAHCNIANASQLLELLGPRIKTLDLSGNHIEKLNATTFGHFTQLQNLNLSRTKLLEIDLDIFRHSHFLSQADFSYNRLKRVGVSSASSDLGILHLDGNELTDIESFTKSNFPKLTEFTISKNEIPCTALVQFKPNWPDLTFVNNPYEQKHEDCSSVVRLINNLSFVGTFISKWF